MKKILFMAFLLIASYLFIPIDSVQAVSYRNEQLESYARNIDQDISVSLTDIDSFVNVVIFIRFADEIEKSAPYVLEYYENMFNGTNLQKASLRNYFLEASYGKLEINSILISSGSQIIYYDDIHPRAYYEPYDEVTNPIGYTVETQSMRASREHSLLKRAVDFVDAGGFISPSINLDKNNDGEIDALSFLVYGEDNGWNSLLWPHKWELYTYYNFGAGTFRSDAPKINGVYAYTYTFQLLGETSFYRNTVDVFVLAHEMFHVLGAPDLYHYDGYNYISNVGPWGLMDANLTIPPHMLGYMKDYYGGWMSDVFDIDESGSYTIYALQDGDNHLFRINTQYSNEYVYIEYREKKGVYEGELPYSGLLLYRVDFDNAGTGNRNGYYGANGESNNEVFVFRPGIQDVIPPIEFPEEAPRTFAGNINLAALSHRSGYQNAAGKGTNILMFHSDGTLMDIVISNVVVHNGFVTFDVSIPVNLELITDQKIETNSNLVLWNDPSMNYQVRVNNVGNNHAYYTLDGSLPTQESRIYEGSIYINSRQNRVRVSVFNDQDQLVSQIDQSFTFTQNIFAGPNYGNNQNITWLIQPNAFVENFEIDFGNLSYLEEDYDFVYITYKGIKTAYTGSSLEGLVLRDIQETVIIQLVSDFTESNFAGFSTTITYDQLDPIQLIGKDHLIFGKGSDYVEQGVDVINTDYSLYQLSIRGSLDIDNLGVYYIYYHLVNQNGKIIFTLERKVTVIKDLIFPSFDLINNQIIELGSNEIDWTSLILNPTDNTDGVLILSVVEDFVDYHKAGSYRVSVSLKDESNNEYIQTFFVDVLDTVAPEVTLNPGVDTIYQSSIFNDSGVSYFDLDPNLTVFVFGFVDTQKVGTYEINYFVYDSSNNFGTIKRFVNVISKPVDIRFELGNAKTTIFVNEAYIDGLCNVYVDGVLEECEVIESNLDHLNKGTYYITYGITVNDRLYTYRRYIYVVEKIVVSENTYSTTSYFKKDEEVFIQ